MELCWHSHQAYYVIKVLISSLTFVTVPTVNAARGLATQVQSAVGKFTQNFFMAVQPQIIKSYAAKRIDDSHSLVLQSSRLAFILMLALVTPIIFEADYILGLWLKSVPEYTVHFCTYYSICFH